MKWTETSSLMMTTGLLSKKETRASFDEERTRAAAESLTKLESDADATSVICGTLEPKAESPSQILEVA